MAGLLRVGTFDVSPTSRCEDSRLTSLFGGLEAAACDEPTIGTVEPVFEKAAEAFEGRRVGDSGCGLDGALEVLDMADRRFIQEGRVRRFRFRFALVETKASVVLLYAPPSLPGVVLRSWSVLR